MEEPQKKIVVEQDLLQEVWYQIDRYLQKRWPDIFIHDDLMKLKNEIYKGTADYEDERRSRGLFKEAVERVEKKEKENAEKVLKVERRLFEFEKKFEKFSQKKWYQFWSMEKNLFRTNEF